MFTPNDIIIKTTGLFTFCKDYDYEQNKSNLYNLSVQIINEYNIKTLSHITIDIDFVFSKEAGQVFFNFNDRISEMKLSRKVFFNFDRKDNDNLQKEALSVIFHEFYHIYDRENYWELFLTMIPEDKKEYFETGTQFWSEFFAYYKSCEIFADEIGIKKLSDLYLKIRTHKLTSEELNEYFYWISKYIAYSLNDKCKIDLPSNILLDFLIKDSYYKDLKSKLNDILKCYPNDISVDTFIDLGRLYMNVNNCLKLNQITLIPLL